MLTQLNDVMVFTQTLILFENELAHYSKNFDPIFGMLHFE